MLCYLIASLFLANSPLFLLSRSLAASAADDRRFREVDVPAADSSRSLVWLLFTLPSDMVAMTREASKDCGQLSENIIGLEEKYGNTSKGVLGDQLLRRLSVFLVFDDCMIFSACNVM